MRWQTGVSSRVCTSFIPTMERDDLRYKKGNWSRFKDNWWTLRSMLCCAGSRINSLTMGSTGRSKAWTMVVAGLWDLPIDKVLTLLHTCWTHTSLYSSTKFFAEGGLVSRPARPGDIQRHSLTPQHLLTLDDTSPSGMSRHQTTTWSVGISSEWARKVLKERLFFLFRCTKFTEPGMRRQLVPHLEEGLVT